LAGYSEKTRAAIAAWAEYQVVFEPGGTVKTVVADPATLNRVSLP
jgi:hypothetical protein